MNVRSKYHLIIVITISSLLNNCQAQKTIDNIETYLFSKIFKPNASINEFLELDKNMDTIRYWQFNENGKLIKEVDNRISSWSFSMGSQTINKSTTSKKELYYTYHSNGQIENIKEIETKDNIISTRIHDFKYPNIDTIIEHYKIIKGDMLNMDIEITEIKEKSKLKEIIQAMRNHIGGSYTETIQRITFAYNKDNLLTRQNHYFSVNSYTENEEPGIMSEVLGMETIYSYNKKGRIENIQEVEFTEEGLRKLRMAVTFNYIGKTTKIRKIKTKYGINYMPNKVEYTIKYKQNGDLKTIRVNKNYFNYIVN